jgi:hypothetical protein
MMRLTYGGGPLTVLFALLAHGYGRKISWLPDREATELPAGHTQICNRILRESNSLQNTTTSINNHINMGQQLVHPTAGQLFLDQLTHIEYVQLQALNMTPSEQLDTCANGDNRIPLCGGELQHMNATCHRVDYVTQTMTGGVPMVPPSKCESDRWSTHRGTCRWPPNHVCTMCHWKSRAMCTDTYMLCECTQVTADFRGTFNLMQCIYFICSYFTKEAKDSNTPPHAIPLTWYSLRYSYISLQSLMLWTTATAPQDPGAIHLKGPRQLLHNGSYRSQRGSRGSDPN